MKKIISLMLVLVCGMSLVLSGCEKQEIHPVTVGELLDLLKDEGYANIQHEEGSCDYVLLDSGDSKNEDKNDINISINNGQHPILDDVVGEIHIDYNIFNYEVRNLVEAIFTTISNDKEFVDDVIESATNDRVNTIQKGALSFFVFANGDDHVQENENKKYYQITLFILEN